MLIGIDLGTTNSLCAVYEADGPRLLPNAHGELLTPSVVAIDDGGHVLVGQAARDYAVTHPDAAASCFKRWMGTDRTVELAGQTLTAPELSSLLLKSLVADASSALGVAVTEAVITVPAYFNEHQRQATKLAGELAGLTVRRMINEPTAAALTYGFHDRRRDQTLLVFDLGGGTFDVTLMEIFEGTLEIVSTAGESHLGGEDFTERLVAHVLRQHDLQLESAELREPLRVARLRQLCEQAKRRLATEASVPIALPQVDGTLDPDATPVSVSVASFEREAASLVARLRRPIERALAGGEREASDVDDVLLVGGATRLEVARAFVRDFFGREPLCAHDPDHVVALGAAVNTALMNDDPSVADMVMTDVCPFTLGVEIVKEFGSVVRDGYYLPVIHRNTTIPVSREEIVHTMEANQRDVHVKIYQGEGRRTADNLLIGELEVTGLPRRAKGQAVHLRFTYDLNGILEVEAYVPESGKKYNTVLQHFVKGLSAAEIADAVKRLSRLKFYPQDEQPNQQLVRFAERTVGEVGPAQRDSLESAIDAFEAAMQSGDREAFAAARTDLLIVLSGLGHPAPNTTDLEPDGQ